MRTNHFLHHYLIMVNCDNLLTLLPHEEDSNPYYVNVSTSWCCDCSFSSHCWHTKFDEYAACVFLQHITKLLNNASRVDIVWDTYIPTSIKAATREKRGKGARQKVVGMNKLPCNWKCFSVKKPIKKSFFTSYLKRL